MANLVINISSIAKTPENKVYKDIKIPITENFEANYDVNAVKQGLKNIFTWRRGQRILDPLFGNVIYEFVDEPINEITLKNLRAAVLKMLAYEKRIEILSLELTPVEDQNSIYILLKYLIPKLNTADSYSTTVSITSQ